MILFKDDVRVKRLTPALLRILTVLFQEHTRPAVAGRFQRQPDDLVITSINDSRSHMKTSRHYVDEAIDLRTHNFPSRDARRQFRQHLAAALGDQFTVMFENAGTPNEHIHIQPKKGTTYP